MRDHEYSKPQKMVSVQSMRAISDKKRLTDRSDRSHSVYKLTYLVDAITESPVCYISI